MQNFQFHGWGAAYRLQVTVPTHQWRWFSTMATIACCTFFWSWLSSAGISCTPRGSASRYLRSIYTISTFSNFLERVSMIMLLSAISSPLSSMKGSIPFLERCLHLWSTFWNKPLLDQSKYTVISRVQSSVECNMYYVRVRCLPMFWVMRPLTRNQNRKFTLDQWPGRVTCNGSNTRYLDIISRYYLHAKLLFGK